MKLRKVIGLFVFLLLGTRLLHAGDKVTLPDSINQQLKAFSSDEEQLEYLKEQVLFFQKTNGKLANELAQEYLTLARTIGVDAQIAKGLYLVGKTFNDLAQYTLAEKHLLAAIQLSDDENNNARIYNELGVVYDFLGNWKSSMEAYFKALRAYESTGDSIGIAHAYNNIGLIHFDLKEVAEADSFFHVTLEFGKRLNDPDLQAMAYSNLAMVYHGQGHFARALKYYKKVLEIDLKAEVPSEFYIGSDYNSIASCYMELGQFNLAHQYFEKALIHKKRSGNERSLASTYHKFGILKIKQGTIASALQLLNEAERLTKKVGDPDFLMEIYESKAKANEIAGRLNASIDYLRKKDVIKDSLYNADVLNSTKRIEEEFNSEKNAATIDSLTGKIQKKDSLLGFLMFGVIILVIFGLFILAMYRLIRQKNRELQTAREELDEVLLQLHHQKKEVERQNIRLESALKIKTRFLSVISHEIRTPLHVIQGIAEIIRSGDLNDEQTKQIGVLMNSSRQLAQLVNEILDLNKLEAGKYTLHQEMFDFRQMITDLFEAQRYHASSNNLQTLLHLDANLPQFLYTDKVKLQQVINNLVGNAVKFTNTGTIKLNLVLVNEDHNDATIRFEVEDTGIGISAEERVRIFEPFHQSDYSMSRNRDGSGLGLPITKGLIELLGGELELDSVLGQGSKFSFTLTLRKGHKRVTHEKPQLDSSLEWPASRKVLVAEDHEQNVLILKMILKKVGIEATYTKNGLEALNASKEEDFDIVLMDLHMPVMDGMEASKKIRQFANTRDRQPIIIGLTASNEEEVSALPMGLFDQVLYKPYRPQELYAVLEESLLAFV